MKFKNLFKKKKVYTMDLESANDTLQNVFAAVDQEPNIVPFDKIVLRQKANTFSTTLCKYATLIMILLLLIIPFFTLQSNASVHSDVGESNINIVDHYIGENTIHLTLDSNNYYYPSCYSIDAEGHRHLPIVNSEDPCHLIFQYTGVELNIYIADIHGEYYQLIVTPNN
jgi:hypothetical protein